MEDLEAIYKRIMENGGRLFKRKPNDIVMKCLMRVKDGFCQNCRYDGLVSNCNLDDSIIIERIRKDLRKKRLAKLLS